MNEYKLVKVLEDMAKVIAERLHGHDKEILELQEYIKKLEQEPRQTLKQKIRARGQA